MINNKEKLLFMCCFFGAVSIEGSYYKAALILATKSSGYVKSAFAQAKDIALIQAHRVQNTFKTNDAKTLLREEQFSQSQNLMPGVAQAAKTDGDLAAKSMHGWLNFDKSSRDITQNITNNHYYGRKTWHETFAEWLKNGGQTRAAGTGFVLGGLGGYGLHAAITAKHKESAL